VPRPNPMGVARLGPPNITAHAPPSATHPARPAGLPPAAAPPPAPPPTALPSTALAQPPAHIGQQSDNPWLRGLVISPSIHASMSVAVFGAQDYRQLTRFMQKPTSAIVMGFTDDPYWGVTSDAFRGPAVAFLPTLSFGTRTAGLQ